MLVFFPALVFSQLTVTNTGNSGNISFLIPQVLQGGGVTVTNPSYVGDANQLGTFSASGSNLPFTDGIILCTGNITAAVGPNDTTAFSAPVANPSSGDSDLDQLSGISTSEASIIEFDFVPIGNTISLRYAFASEEYNEEVCASEVDQIGIFISGPGITGPYTNNAINIATNPNGLPVNVNSINNGSPGVGNAPTSCFGGGGLLASDLYHDNSTLATTDSFVQFDGWTTALTAITNLDCDSTYHLKVVLGRGGTNPGESALLLESGGLFSNGVAFSWGPYMGDSAIVEGCGSAVLTFFRTDTSFTESIDLHIGGSAVNGTDYTLIDSTLTFQVGQDSANVFFTPLVDGVVEGTETVDIWYTITSPCGKEDTLSIEIKILDEYPVYATLTSSDSLICEGDQITLSASAMGGNGPYFYLWSGQPLPASFSDNPNTTTTYTVAAYDQAGCPGYADVTVEVNPTPVADLGPDRNVCTLSLIHI